MQSDLKKSQSVHIHVQKNINIARDLALCAIFLPFLLSTVYFTFLTPLCPSVRIADIIRTTFRKSYTVVMLDTKFPISISIIVKKTKNYLFLTNTDCYYIVYFF